MHIPYKSEEGERLRLMSLVTEHSDNAIVITDGDWKIVYVNAGFERMSGYSLDEVCGSRPIALLVPQLASEIVRVARSHLLKGDSYKTEELITIKNGERIWCNLTINPVLDSNGWIINTVGILTDITSSKIHEVLQHSMLNAMVREVPLEELMALACREIERIAPEVTISVLQINDDGRLHPLAAPSLPTRYAQQLEGLTIEDGTAVFGAAASPAQPFMSHDIESDPAWENLRPLMRPLGLKSCWTTPIMGSNNRVIGTLALYYKEIRPLSTFHQQLIDVIAPLCALALEREKARAHISQLAFYDSLTELPNRSLLNAKAEHALNMARRNRESLAVLFIDLDRFKQVNDSLGHPAGDEYLQTVAKRLRANRRRSDIVARLSGDEFIVVLPQCDNVHVTDIVEQIKLTLSQPCHIAGTTLAPSASIGISIFPEDGGDMGTLIHRADMAMYQAKSAGRGRFSFFCHELNQLAQERQALENALSHALKHNELALHYQPQVNLLDGTLYGVEALARWTHPELGTISPVRFIPMAEECGLIGDLGLWAIREGCRQLGIWRSKGLTIPTMSINISPTNFHNLDLPDTIMSALNQNRLQPEDLTLELTESILMDTNPSTMNVLQAVHDLGIRLAMDDFGTGYSSLSYLRRLPIQELKLDRSFVLDLENDATSQALSDAVIHIGKSLHLKVVAEGIETEGQYEILRQQGYHVGQGYLFSKPLNAADLEQWLSAD